MGTNSWWIKTDYRVQTILGSVMLILTGSALLGSLAQFVGLEDGFMLMYVSICITLLLFMPLGVWQLMSGFVHAFNGDKLQRIYLMVDSVYFSGLYVFYKFYPTNYDIVSLILSVIPIIIAIWKYTVVRADYISLKIVDVPESESQDLLDA